MAFSPSVDDILQLELHTVIGTVMNILWSGYSQEALENGAYLGSETSQ